MPNEVNAPQADPIPNIDIGGLREKYRQERDKRLRRDGLAQYIETKGDFATYVDDIWSKERIERAPVHDEVEVLIVGGGFGGLLAAARLHEVSISNIKIIEKGADFGGAWYWNRYPGAACDTESYIYLPLLEETGYIPERKYSRASEIFGHARRIGETYGLYDKALFQTIAKEMRWDEKAYQWVTTTDRGDEIRSRYVVLGAGALDVPKLPGIPGIETFKGVSFHTSRWNYDYTGGSSAGDLSNLRDKRVGIIGTGATAVQCIPHLGQSAKELFVFQRTPPLVDVRNDRPTDQDWAQSLTAGWQRARMDNFTAVLSGEEFEEDLVNDGWTDLIGGILLAARKQALGTGSKAKVAELAELADLKKMERVRARVSSTVRDETTAEALKPWYNAFCKRPCFHDGYLDTFNLPNVHLIDTQGLGVEQITETGVVVAGKEYELDCLIFATGFEVASDLTKRAGFEVYGRDGISLTESWKNGTETLHGYISRGFPNCFFVSSRQAGNTPNNVHTLDELTSHFAYVVKHARELGALAIEPSAEAQEAWVQEVVRAARGRQSYLAECTPGYFNNEGESFDERASKNSQYWRGPIVYMRILDEWRREGSLAGLELTMDGADAKAVQAGGA